MPIYEYVCSRCSSEFEVLHRSASEQKPSCPNCGASEVRRKLSVFGFSCGEGFVSSSSGKASCGSCRSRDCSHCG